VQDGLAYLSNWNDGLIILDVGNGMQGRQPVQPAVRVAVQVRPERPVPQVEATGGPGFIRGTHTAWRHRDYVFIADEVFPAPPQQGARDAAADRAYGRLQVIDVSDIENPRSVAWYEPEYGGVHNVWVEATRCTWGVQRRLPHVRHLRRAARRPARAGREIAHLNTADMHGVRQNTAMTWGVVVKDGLAYVNDNHNGLWIVPEAPTPNTN
jgi:hypothetical protein